MKTMTIPTFAIASGLAAALAFGQAQAEVIKPTGGLTRIRTTVGEITMVHTLTPMNNAHDVQMIGFVKPNRKGPATHIPFEFERGYEPLLSMRTGADCMVSSSRVMRDGQRLRVAYAQRQGEWFDQKPVTIQVFELTANDDEAPGTPALYFTLRKTVETKKTYCDVNEALDKEAASYTLGAK